MCLCAYHVLCFVCVRVCVESAPRKKWSERNEGIGTSCFGVDSCQMVEVKGSCLEPEVRL